jgi:hypothetical protein
LEEELTFTDEPTMNAWLEDARADAEGHGYPTHIDIRYHEHDPSEDCECAQYEQDHAPAIVVNDPDTRARW